VDSTPADSPALSPAPQGPLLAVVEPPQAVEEPPGMERERRVAGAVGLLQLEMLKGLKLKQIQRIQGESPYAKAGLRGEGGQPEGEYAQTLPDEDAGPAPLWGRRHRNVLGVLVPAGPLEGLALEVAVSNAKKPKVDMCMGDASYELQAVLNECAGAKKAVGKVAELRREGAKAGELHFRVSYIQRAGVVRIRVKGASELKEGASCCRLSLAGGVAQTTVLPGASPQWAQDFELSAFNLAEDILKCQVLQYVDHEPDDSAVLGVVSIPVNDIVQASTMDTVFPLQSGSVSLCLEWTPGHDCDDDE